MMKTYKKILIFTFAILFIIACDNDGYIDPIAKVEPGEDVTAPTVVISNPNIEKIVIPFPLESTDLDFQFEITDDIEIANITVYLDGTELTSFNEFLDFRRYTQSISYEDLEVGEHIVEVTATDLSGKSTTASHEFEVGYYDPKYDGEIFYMPFEAGSFAEHISRTFSTVEGSPGFAPGKIGQAYSGSTGDYLTFPSSGLTSEEFSATFWLKIDALPDRAGILVMGPEDVNNASYPDVQNLRTSGFRFFREAAGNMQRFKLNVGNGAGDNWFDGGAAADVDPSAGEWVHFAFTVSGTECVVYINGGVVSQGNFTGIDWTGVDFISIMSGDPRFTEWGHHSDESYMDELRLFNKALTQEEIQNIIDDES
jgi:hypothetical protein